MDETLWKPKESDAHDGGREFISNKFKDFLRINGIKDKQIPKGYPQEQGKVEAYTTRSSYLSF